MLLHQSGPLEFMVLPPLQSNTWLEMLEVWSIFFITFEYIMIENAKHSGYIEFLTYFNHKHLCMFWFYFYFVGKLQIHQTLVVEVQPTVAQIPVLHVSNYPTTPQNLGAFAVDYQFPQWQYMPHMLVGYQWLHLVGNSF